MLDETIIRGFNPSSILGHEVTNHPWLAYFGMYKEADSVVQNWLNAIHKIRDRTETQDNMWENNSNEDMS